MIHLKCAAGHESARLAHESHSSDPRCHALAEGGFCLRPAWQDPATVRKGDVVAVLDDRRIIRCIVESWSGDPDRQAELVDEFGMTRRLYIDSWFTPGQPYLAGCPILAVADAAHLRPELEVIAGQARKARRQAKREARHLAMQEGSPGRGRGRLAAYDVPFTLHDHRQDANMAHAFSTYLIEHPLFVEGMAWMERYHPRYYRMLVMNLHEDRGPAEISDLIGISRTNSKVRLHRARQKLIGRLTPDLSVTTSSGQDRVEYPAPAEAAS